MYFAAGMVLEGGYDMFQLLAAAHLLGIKELAELAAQACSMISSAFASSLNCYPVFTR